jgi:hypothetical protein
MNSKYDWDSFPKSTIDVRDLEKPFEISNHFKQRSIDKYVYCIMFKGIIIKYGMSAPKSYTRDWGERVYRQIGHCYSWGEKIRLNGSSGSDWLIIERDFKNLYGIDLDHRYIKIIVWDVTKYDFKSVDPFDEVRAMESEKINNYRLEYGETPVGNIHDEENYLNRHYVKTAVFNNVFISE